MSVRNWRLPLARYICRSDLAFVHCPQSTSSASTSSNHQAKMIAELLAAIIDVRQTGDAAGNEIRTEGNVVDSSLRQRLYRSRCHHLEPWNGCVDKCLVDITRRVPLGDTLVEIAQENSGASDRAEEGFEATEVNEMVLPRLPVAPPCTDVGAEPRDTYSDD